MKILTIISILFIFFGCGRSISKQVRIIDSNAPMTDECAMEKEVCKEAIDFQREYDRLPAKEKKDMAQVLNTYTNHCEQARKLCKKSRK